LRLAGIDVAEGVDGVLLDIGVSSPQLDQGERGFSFRYDAPLDMRMDTTQGETAAQWLQRASVQEITEVIRNYGEERFAVQIAKKVVAARGERPLATTGELAALVRAAVRTREPGKDAATRTFQALRIHINQELEQLTLVLPQAMTVLKPGGRLVVISFHSLEDRIVKRFMRDGAAPDQLLSTKLPLRAVDLPQPELRLVGKPLKASEEEVAANPRARSAVMRVAEKLAGRRPEMVRLNLLLLLVVMLCSLGVVTSQHKARQLFQELDVQHERTRQLEVEFGQLQLELSTWGTAPRIEKIAVEKLGMRTPDAETLLPTAPIGGASR
jgi:16S rRNA (cytosine1402-N4)-methyltransferase